MNKPISILLVDDHTLMRRMLGDRLASEPDMQVVATADNADTAVAEAIRHRPDIVLMDIDMTGLSCFQVARTMHRQYPETCIIYLSAFFNDCYIEQALAVGAAGYLTKSEPPEAVMSAIRAVAAGGSYFSPEVQSRIVVDSHGTRLMEPNRSRASTLSNRELEVLRYLANGMSKKEVAQTMHISVKTVERHCCNLMEKLDIHDRVELTRFAIREGFAQA
ncbi:MAG: response regulator transcription factor [Planctomycetes bacterium]|nr:response regulator transcription factor [Planctomycetota bacterium]